MDQSPEPGARVRSSPGTLSQPVLRAGFFFMLLVFDFIRQEPLVARLYNLTQRYEKLMRERDFEAFDLWLATCLRCGLPDLESFAQGLQKDYEATKAALVLLYSNGPVEGQVNRLKYIKRSMYGRGSFELLRQRVLDVA